MGDVDALTGQLSAAVPGRRYARRAPVIASARSSGLPGPRTPAVYRVAFACACGGEHAALVGHDALDWAPLGPASGRSST